MKKKTSLINLTNTEIKKNELKETLAGQHGANGGKHYGNSESGAGLLAAAPITCSAWCTCSCGYWSTSAFTLMNFTGENNAGNNEMANMFAFCYA